MEPKSDLDASSSDQVNDSTKANSPSSSFASDSLGGSNSGWVNQSGGFDTLSGEDQDKACQSHAEWQARDPEKHTFELGDYVSYAQERNEEVASFVNCSQPSS